MYELSGPPFRVCKKDANFLRDRADERIRLMGASRQILRELATEERWRGTTVAYVSRTEYPQWAGACLKLFQVADGVSMDDVGEQQEIYPGSKTTHFRRLHQRTGIPYEEMLFFDNERWNITDVAPMGVCSVYTPDGMTEEVWGAGLRGFAAAAEARGKGKAPVLEIGCTSRRRW